MKRILTILFIFISYVASAQWSDLQLFGKIDGLGNYNIAYMKSLLDSINKSKVNVNLVPGFQPLDGDLTAIGNLSVTGVPRKTGVNTWDLSGLEDAINDGTTNRAPTENAVFDQLAGKQPLDAGLTTFATLDVAGNAGKKLEWDVSGNPVASTQMTNPATANLDQIYFDGSVFQAKAAGAANTIWRMNAAANAFDWGSIDLSASNAVGTSRLAHTNLAQLAGVSVLGVQGLSTGNLAAITAGTENFILGRNTNNVTFQDPSTFGILTLAGSGQTVTKRVTFATPSTTGTGSSAGMVITAPACTTCEILNLSSSTITTGKGIVVTSPSMTGGTLIDLSLTGNGAQSNSQKVLAIATSGANTNNNETTHGISISNTHTGAGSVNKTLELTASGGATENTALEVVAGDVKLTPLAGTGTRNLVVNSSNVLTIGGVVEQEATVTLSTADILSGNSVPVQIVAAQGAGTLIVITSPIVCKFKFGSAAFATNVTHKFYYGTSAYTNSIQIIDQTADAIQLVRPIDLQGPSLENKAINFQVDTGNPTGGTGSTMVVYFKYKVVTL